MRTAADTPEAAGRVAALSQIERAEAALRELDLAGMQSGAFTMAAIGRDG